ncbi:hypothetical protein D3C81_693760 [compost metagenome]
MATLGHHQRRSTVACDLIHATGQFGRHSAAECLHMGADRIGGTLADLPAVQQVDTRHAGLRAEGQVVGLVRLGGGAALLAGQAHDRLAFRRRVGQRREQRRLTQLVGVDPGQCMEVAGLAVAVGDGAGLVEQQHVDVTGHFHRLARLGQHVGGQRTVHAGDADGRQQATDGGRDQAHQQRDQQQRINLDAHRGTDRRQRCHHHQERQRHRRQQQGQRDFIRCLLPVGAFHQRDHPVQEAVPRLGGDAYDDLVGQHLGAADHAGAISTRLAQHRCRLAGHRRFVDGGQALHDLAVGRHQLAGTDDHVVAGTQFGGRHLGFAGTGLRRRQTARHQVLAGAAQRGGLATATCFGHGLGEIAEQHGDQQDRRHRQAEAQWCIAGQGDDRGDDRAGHHHRHHRAAHQVHRRQLAYGLDERAAQAGGIEQGRAGRHGRGTVCGCVTTHGGVLSAVPGSGGRRSGRVPAPA